MSAYIPPSIRTVREDIQQTVVLSGGQVIPAFIGTALGQSVPVAAEEFSLGATTTFQIPDLSPQGPVSGIIQLRSQSSGGILYVQDTDFTFNVGLQTITWLSVSLSSPYMLPPVVETGGTLAAGTYYYVITALRTLNITGPVLGETAASNEVSAVVGILGSGKTNITWQSVPGAEAYKIYRTTIQGNYTGSALLAQVTGGFTGSFVDTGAATSVGSPPGVALAGTVVNTPAQTYVIEPGQTLAVKFNGAAALTATFTATAASRDSAAVWPVVLGVDTLTVSINGGATQTVTFAGTETTRLDVANTINGQLVGAAATDTGLQVRITSDRRGTGSSVNVTGGTANAVLLFTVGAITGTGNVSNIDAVTAAEVVAVLTPVIVAVGTAVVDGGTRVRVTTLTLGVSGSVQFDPAVTGGTANGVVGFDTILHSGSSASASTALRRPALNGTPSTVVDKFFMDYVYVKNSFFEIIKYTNLSVAQTTYGLGSNLTVALTLAMGRSGLGNNASAALGMSIPDNTLPTYQAAFDIFLQRRDVDIIVPCSSAVNVQTALKAHVVFASNIDQKRERYGIVGTLIDTPVGDETTSGTAIYQARALNERRMTLVYPWANIDVQQPDLTVVTTEMDGWTVAACLAGLSASLPDRAEPATAKQVFGITTMGGPDLDETTMNSLGESGVTVIHEEDGQLVVRDNLLTQIANDEDRHPNILLVEDFLRKTLRFQFKSFRGRKLLPGLLNQIEKRTNKILQQMVKLQLIVGFDAQSIAAEQDADNLTFIIVRFSYQPIFPTRVIEFRYSFDLRPAALAA